MDKITHHEVSSVMKQLHALLSTCSSLFHTPISKYPLLYCCMGGNTNAMHGIVTLHEDMLCSMELLIKPTKMSSIVKATFRDDKQWKLQQVQDAINHLKQAANALIPFSGTPESVPENYSPEYIISVIDNVTRCINMCRMRLFSPCKLSLEALVSSGIVKMFSPPLPGETIVNLFILEDCLVVTHYTVQQIHTSISKQTHPSRTPLLFHPVGTIFAHAGSRYEVATAHRAECYIPWLGKLLEATSLSLQLGYELRRKMIVLSKC